MNVEQLALAVVVGLAAYRVARLVAKDTITDPLRSLLGRWAWDGSIDDYRSRPRAFVWTLLTCPYCLSVWFGVAAWLCWTLLWEPPVVIAAAAGVAALCAGRDH